MAPGVAAKRTTAAAGPDVVAAGAVVVRRTGQGGGSGGEVLLVHRPKYDDWAFPKGKQDPGEHVTVTAAREVLEETGLAIRLGRPLPPQLYAISGGRAKMVHYWVGRVIGDDDVSGFQVNPEIDEVAWVPLDKARKRLTYQDDADLLALLAERPSRTAALVVLRHARAGKRARWDGPDEQRPLTRVGRTQAAALAPVLAAYGARRVVTSDSVRCRDTVAPYAASVGRPLEERCGLSEERHTPASVDATVTELLAGKKSAVLCTHRPVLPLVFESLGLPVEPLSPGELVVVHHRADEVVAVERHLVR